MVGRRPEKREGGIGSERDPGGSTDGVGRPRLGGVSDLLAASGAGRRADPDRTERFDSLPWAEDGPAWEDAAAGPAGQDTLAGGEPAAGDDTLAGDRPPLAEGDTLAGDDALGAEDTLAGVDASVFGLGAEVPAWLGLDEEPPDTTREPGPPSPRPIRSAPAVAAARDAEGTRRVIVDPGLVARTRRSSAPEPGPFGPPTASPGGSDSEATVAARPPRMPRGRLEALVDDAAGDGVFEETREVPAALSLDLARRGLGAEPAPEEPGEDDLTREEQVFELVGGTARPSPLPAPRPSPAPRARPAAPEQAGPVVSRTRTRLGMGPELERPSPPPFPRAPATLRPPQPRPPEVQPRAAAEPPVAPSPPVQIPAGAQRPVSAAPARKRLLGLGLGAVVGCTALALALGLVLGAVVVVSGLVPGMAERGGALSSWARSLPAAVRASSPPAPTPVRPAPALPAPEAPVSPSPRAAPPAPPLAGTGEGTPAPPAEPAPVGPARAEPPPAAGPAPTPLLPDEQVLPMRFAPARSTAEVTDRAWLRRLADAIQAERRARLEVVGFAAPAEEADPARRDRLALRRAEAAVEAIRALGPSGRRFQARAAGPADRLPEGANAASTVLRVVRR